MKFKKFIMLAKNDTQQVDEEVEMIINLDHVISVKPIRMMAQDRRVIKGYWVRLSNGKKYKATSIPQELLDALKEDSLPMAFLDSDASELAVQ